MLARIKPKKSKSKLKKGESNSSVISGISNLESSGEWVDVQERVFTNWINDKLKGTTYRVRNLFKDLEDGLILIALLELLSGKKVTGK